MELRKKYPELQDKLSEELRKESLDSENFGNLNLPFMQEVLKIRPSFLTNEEIDTRVEIIALRIRKVFKKMGFPACQ
jgi:hypothetical protein